VVCRSVLGTHFRAEAGEGAVGHIARRAGVFGKLAATSRIHEYQICGTTTRTYNLQVTVSRAGAENMMSLPIKGKHWALKILENLKKISTT
jgi:hypothetical protein